MSRTFAFVAITLVTSIVACSSYTAAPSTGGIGEACNEDGTCLAPLICVDRVCKSSSAVSEDSGSATQSDTGAESDATSDARSDAPDSSDAGADVAKPAPCDALPSAAPAGVVECVDVSCLPGKVCCTTSHTCLSSCGDFQVAMPCDGADDCPMGNVCCADLGNTVNTAVCPRSGSFSKLKTRCATSCNGAEVELCTDATCKAGKRCTRILAQLGGGGGANFNVNYCE